MTTNRRPEFSIIAGPNGAGKSNLCPQYVCTPSFDGDKIALNLREEHPDWPDRWIEGSVATLLEKQKKQALTLRTNFAFETNFSTESAIKMVEEFKNAGFKISLYYFGLRTEQESICRVMQRFLTGGHDVSKEVIRYNFQQGLKNIKKHLDKFENITFVDGNETYGRIIALHIPKNNIHYVCDSPPQWFNEQFYNEFKLLNKSSLKNVCLNIKENKTFNDAVKYATEYATNNGLHKGWIWTKDAFLELCEKYNTEKPELIKNAILTECAKNLNEQQLNKLVLEINNLEEQKQTKGLKR